MYNKSPRRGVKLVRKEALITVLTLTLFIALAVPLYASEGASFDVLHHEMKIGIDPDARFMNFIVYVDFVALEGDLSSVEFSLNDEVALVGVVGTEGAMKHTREGDKVKVYLDTPLLYGQVKTLRFDYSYISDGDKEGFLWGYVGDEVSYLIYENLWYPMVWGDRATATISITVPEGLTAISVGELAQTIPGDGITTFIWKTDSPSRGISLVAGEYVVQTKEIYIGEVIPQDYENSFTLTLGAGENSAVGENDGRNDLVMVSTYLFPEDVHKADETMWYTSRILKGLSHSLGSYPYKEFRVVEMPDFFFGGHGDQEFIMVRSTAIHLDADEFMAHEIAHSWWGSYVFAEGGHTVKSTDGLKIVKGSGSGGSHFSEIANGNNLWLHEGFAAYSGVLYVEEEYGREAMLTSMEDKRDEFLNTVLMYGDKAITDMEEEYSDNQYHAIVYSKGAYVLHMLRYVVGDAVFSDILGAYQDEYGGKSASVEDFKRVAEEVYSRDMDWFFDQWLHSTALPDYSVGDVEMKETSGGYFVNVHVVQEGDIINMPVEVAVRTSKGVQTERVWVLGDGKVVKFFTKEMPRSIEIDGDQWILETERSNNIYTVDPAMVIDWLPAGKGSIETPDLIDLYLLAVLGVMAYLFFKKWSDSPPIEF